MRFATQRGGPAAARGPGLFAAGAQDESCVHRRNHIRTGQHIPCILTRDVAQRINLPLAVSSRLVERTQPVGQGRTQGWLDRRNDPSAARAYPALMLPIPGVGSDAPVMVANSRARRASMLRRTSPPSTTATALTGK